MSGNKYISNNAGSLTEVAAIQTSAGAGDAGKIPALDSTGRLDATLMPVGIGADTATIAASENLAAGNFVNIYDSTGALDGSGARARKSDGSAAGKEVHGFVLSAVTSGENALVYFEGPNTQVTGATPGVVFMSATTPGGFTSTAPTTAGHVVQRIGVATSATSINLEHSQPIVLA
jgi:hypothetical protein